MSKWLGNIWLNSLRLLGLNIIVLGNYTQSWSMLLAFEKYW